jgi:hypothetical protein
MTTRDWQAQQFITRGNPSATASSEFLRYLNDIRTATAESQAAITAIDAGVTDLAASIADEQTLQNTAITELQSDISTLAIWNTTQDAYLAPLILAQRTYGQLTSDYTLTSTTSAQKLFNWSTYGALTLQTGRYRFNSMIYLTTMSATSGNGQFQLLGGGTASLARVLYQVVGIDSTTPLAAAAMAGSASITSSSAASMVTADVGTGLITTIDGVFNVTAAGTIIPSIALVTANAAVVQAGSYFECAYMGEIGAETAGTWS